mmetsp:Transcript_93416/g.273498  ORF Transcript_93416/g.273498 Transcript_93416/m.273498 type:complete len:231 (-) Transcript_93416:355-1047(-)
MPVGKVHDHDSDVVAAVLLQAHADDVRRHVAQVCAGVAPELVAHVGGHLHARHHVPDAVAAQDGDGARGQAGDLVDVRDARDLLNRRMLVGVRLVLKIAEASAHSKVAIQARRVLLRDLAACSFDPRLLRGMVRLVVHALRDHRPDAFWCALSPLDRGRVAAQGVEVRGAPDGQRNSAALLLRRTPHDEAAGVSAVAKFQIVGAVALLGHERAHDRGAGVLLWLLSDVLF